MTAFEKRLLIIYTLMRNNEPMTRADIEQLINLGFGATINILNELINSGFVKRVRRDVAKKYMGYVATDKAREWFKI